MVRGLTDGSVTEGQVAAFAMAVFFKGMAMEERVALTMAMRDSGPLCSTGATCRAPALDKHSTGGVGDTVSLMLAPAVAACGGYVPMISGRGSAIRAARSTSSIRSPAMSRSPDEALFRKVTREVGCAIIGQRRRWRPPTSASTASAM